jgi:ABC-type molybdate transport system ATPase subunit
MAVLTDAEKLKVMQFMEGLADASGVPVDYVKAVIRDAAQAVEDLLTASTGMISTTINTATSPHGITLSADQKRWLVAKVFELKFRRDGV